MIQVTIPNYKCVEINGSLSHNRAYHVYTIQVNNGISTYTLEKRYSDFHQLHKELKKQHDTPDFPPKRVRNNRSIVLESRRLALQTYLQIMVQMNPIAKEICNFLNLQLPQQSRQSSSLNSWYDDQSSTHSLAIPGHSNGGSNGFDIDSVDGHRYGGWASHAFSSPAASFIEDPFLLESDSSSSNLSDCVTRGVLDALYETDI